jgi:hypothetical protein
MIRPLQHACLLALALAACGAETPRPGTSIDRRVTVLDPSGELVITDDQITLPRASNEALLGLRAGDIIVTRRGEGLLRRVEAVSAALDQIVIDTVAAELGDALIDGELADTLDVRDKGDKGDHYGLGTITFSVQDATPISSATATVRIRRARVKMVPSVDLDLAVRSRRVSSFEAILRGHLEADLDLDIEASQVGIMPRIPLWKSEPMIFVQQVGVLPVVETLTLQIGLRIEVTAVGQNQVSLSGGVVSDFVGGLRFADGSRVVVAGEDHVLDGQAPLVRFDEEVISVRAYLYTQADLRLYGTAGPYINVGPYLEIEHPVGGGEDRGAVGLFGEVGGEAKLLGLDLQAFTTPLFDVSRPLGP